VRNLADGRVEVVAAGDPGRLEEMARHLGSGPRFSRVDRVERVNVPHEAVDVKSFEIR
jgi:acylphosphatase